jgi:hypothetical protein
MEDKMVVSKKSEYNYHMTQQGYLLVYTLKY